MTNTTCVLIAALALGCSGNRASDGPCPSCAGDETGSPGPQGASGPGEAGKLDGSTAPAPRLVAYVNCLCGFGVGSLGGTCLADPDPAVNHIKAWEDNQTSPITHYVISFLSFTSAGTPQIRTDPGAIWNNPNGSSTDFTLHPNLREAMKSAQSHGKKIMLSLGGEAGSAGFLNWRNAVGAAGMRAEIQRVADLFAAQNGLAVDGFDVDIELGSYYAPTSDKYLATRDLINAVPDQFLVAFVPQVGNGLCAAPNVGDPLNPQATLGGQCQQPNNDDAPWALARLDRDCRRGNAPKLDYFGIQYYNAGQAVCCGGGETVDVQVTSTVQNYANLANGWPAFGNPDDPQNPWRAFRFFPGPWAAFGGIGADRLVLGKPGCQGCAGSDYVDIPTMTRIISQLDHRLDKPMGGILFWDLCRLFGNVGPQCVSGTCQPSWGGQHTLDNLTTLRSQMTALQTR